MNASDPARSRDVGAAFERRLPPATRPIVGALRQVVLREAPGAAESLLWGGLSYHRPDVGGRVKGSVCFISVKHGRVRLEFIHGVRLPDPHGLLQGSALSKRFLQLASAQDARRPEVAALVRAAAALDPDAWPCP